MGRRPNYQHKEISSDTLIQYWKDACYRDEVEKAAALFRRSVDRPMLESLKWEGLWRALATYRGNTKLELKYWVYRKVRWTIIRYIDERRSRHEFSDEEELDVIPDRNNNLLEIENQEYLAITLRSKCSDRDIKIFGDYLEGYTALEIADRHSCGKKNVHRIITRCKGLIKANATRVDLSR